MKAMPISLRLWSLSTRRACIVISAAVLLIQTSVLGQGTITFNARPFFSGTNYVELGMRFQVVNPPGTSGRDNMAIISASDPFMIWFRQFNPFNYVELSLTNGSTFGLTSVWLADPSETSPSQVPISFIGSLANGSSVTNTFVTLGSNKYAFQNYMFTPEFAADLISVQIDAPRWAMDNLVFVIPEPGAAGLFVFGLVAVVASRRKAI